VDQVEARIARDQAVRDVLVEVFVNQEPHDSDPLGRARPRSSSLVGPGR
jgi:hypothetical protein